MSLPRWSTGTIQLPKLIFGCWPLGGRFWGEIDHREMKKTIDMAIDFGITAFDTAPLYGEGEADKWLLRHVGNRKHRIEIITKVGVQFSPHAQSHLRPDLIRADVEQSLSRLKLEQISLLQIHWPCEHTTPLEDSIAELEHLKDRGVIAEYGLCNYSAKQIEKLPQNHRVQTLQTPYSMLRREAELGIFQQCEQRSISVLAYETLCRGLLSGKYREPFQGEPPDLRLNDPRFCSGRFWSIREFCDKLERVAAHIRYPAAALPLAWAMAEPQVKAVIVGIKNRSQLRENISAVELLHRDKLISILRQVVDQYAPK